MSRHERLAASASSRWIACTGSVQLIEELKAQKKIPKSTTNPAAERGTAVHHIIEQHLLGKRKVSYFLGKALKVSGMANPCKINAKDIQSARKCIKYVNKRLKKYPKAKMYPERRYDLSKVYDMPVGGTSDVTIAVKNGILEIIDYKNGKGYVDAELNSQLRIYALGAWYALHDKFNFKSVKVTIVQPNCSWNNADSIRSETFSVDEMVDWERGTLVPAIEKIRSGRTELVPDEEKQCLWCEAKAHCTAREKNKVVLTKDAMSGIIKTTDAGAIPDPESLTDEEFLDCLENADAIINFYVKCKRLATERLKDNSERYDGWELKPSLGNRKYKDEKTLNKKLRRFKITLEDVTIHQDRLMSPAELEKFLKEENDWDSEDVSSFMEEVVVREPTGNFVLAKAESALDDFAEFANKDPKKSRTKKRRNRRSKNG